MKDTQKNKKECLRNCRHTWDNKKKAQQYYGNKEKLQKCPQNRYRNLFVDEKRKKSEFKKNNYKNLSKAEKEKLKEYERN